MSKVRGNAFWQWSNDAYEMPGAKNRLIYMQDDFGFDVNLTLWCCWRASEGETLGKDALKEAEKAVSDWSEGVIEPLREARRNAKDGPPGLYEQIKAAELEAEHREQDILYGLSRPGTPIGREDMLDAARNNLALYASLIDAPRRSGFTTTLLRDLADHIFPASSAGKS
ncbi:TIGR02444 family protein [Hyphococcus luteus]|jgi:uncharacterized protein (TIGR02444 family)|uniref:TIGR02444 family protein n=1 Tax=Hyphococcus luteus TaxID=2058213 RepID=A0A2S7K4U7_9PROT|nr:TIGR02444 family protein [Marinicaulis flavus]PQA87519.1 TIGR02444 family protein [Marinicaulis flavus]